MARFLIQVKKFKKRDGDFAQFIDISQEYEYKEKIKENVISILLNEEILKKFGESLNLNEKVNIVGSLNTYIDKNKQTKAIINCTNIEILSKNITQDIER